MRFAGIFLAVEEQTTFLSGLFFYDRVEIALSRKVSPTACSRRGLLIFGSFNGICHFVCSRRESRIAS